MHYYISQTVRVLNLKSTIERLISDNVRAYKKFMKEWLMLIVCMAFGQVVTGKRPYFEDRILSIVVTFEA